MANRTISQAVAHLLGGVTQQPENVRYLNAASESINAFPSIAQGLDKRPGSQFIAVGYQPAGVGNSIQVVGHFINRDSQEKYALVLYRDGTAGVNWSAKAVSLVTGEAVPIYSDTSGTALGAALNDYLRPAALSDEQVTDPNLDIRMMTVGDTTFLLNRRRFAKMESGTTGAMDNLALIVVRAGVYGQKYSLTIDGDIYQVNFKDIQENIGDGLTPDGQIGTHTRYIAPDVILQRILNDINGASVNVTQTSGSTWKLVIRNASGGTFKLGFEEFNAGVYNSRVTGNIAYSAAGSGATLASNIDTALEAAYLSGAGTFTVAVVGGSYAAGIYEEFTITTTAQIQLLDVDTNSLTGAGGGFTTSRKSNVATVRLNPDAAFEIEPNDANYTRLLEVVRESVDDINVLPKIAPDGFKVRVSGGNEEDEDDWYAEFASHAGGFGRGEWEESVGWGVKDEVDADTMPHAFVSYVKSSVGTHPAGLAVGDPYFVFGPFAWANREAGDDDSNPIPSVFDKRLDGMGYYRGRLILMSGESIVASEAGAPGNLFRRSVASQLDSDRIDLTSQIRDASDFRAMVEHNERAVLFSDQSQAVLDAGGDLLSGGTAGLQVAGSASVDPDGGPITAGGFIFVPFRRGQLRGGAWSGYSGIYQMVDVRGGEALRLEPVDVTEHCPRYISGRVVQMAASTAENLLAVVTDERDMIYLYRWQDSGDGRRLQSAWQKIRLATSHAETTPPTIVAVSFIESTLYVWTLRDSEGMGVVVEKLDFAAGTADDDFWCQIRLDNRIRSDDDRVSSIALVGSDTVVTMDAGTWKRRGDGATGIVYAVLADVAGQNGGTIYESDAPAGGGGGTNVITFPGVDLTGKEFYIGVKFTMRHTLSRPYLEGEAEGGGRMALVAGHTRIVRAFVDVAEAADLKAEVAYSQPGGTTPTRQFLHTSEDEDVEPFAGTKTVPVDASNDGYALTLINDSPFGSRINGVEYELTYHSRSRRAG